ncbi:FAD-binding oxidoreductase [Methylotenera sp.]|uniref:NAD(P)/FAD-dependent oxidoreductase n=1 Tax=Methylotenera sp. TaxID=2051956 RepID=UPI0024886F1B|nr:FAD-dependent oxidoreductase [Methylotenera sp.]MDI1298327.1 FAD-dependent oxidoreductase [Methylotenera sp.]
MTKHVVIVGGGIVGCMTAMELVGRGCKVTIVERNQIASQTSGESSWAGGGILFPLLPWFYSDAVNTLTNYGAKSYPEICQRLLRETGIDTDFEQSGFLLLPNFDTQAAGAWCASNQLPAQAVKASAFGVQSLSGEDALWLPTIGQIRPPYFMQAMRKWLEKNKVTMLEHTELVPLKEMQKLNEWQTIDGKTISADQFVVTSGAWSFELLKETSAKLNIKPMRGQILLYKPEKNLEQIVYREGFYMIPRRDGHLLAGSTLEDVGFDTTVTQEVRNEISAKAEAIMPALKNQAILKHWSGLRPGTPENLPTISAHPTIENLYLNTGHFRYGLTMAPASAKLVTALMLGEKPMIDASPYRCS